MMSAAPTPPQSKPPVPRHIRRNRTIAAASALAGILLVALLAFFGFVIAAPMPALAVTPTEGYEQSFEVAAVETPWPELPAAISVWGTDSIESNSGEQQVVMASIAKLVCALVSLDAKPFNTTEDETYVLGPKDSAYIGEVLKEDGSTEPVTEGTELTRYQMLELMLLPSANNYALSYVDWMFGSNDAYVAAAHKYLTKHKLTEMTVVEPTGLSFSNVASARNLAALGDLALDQPILAQIMSEKTADIPGVGTIKSSNPLQNDPGVRGMKTGTTTAGRNIVLAQDFTVADRTITAIVVTLGQPSAEGRIKSTRALAANVAANTQQLAVATKGETVATATSWNGEQVALLTAKDASTVLTFNESAKRSLKLKTITPGMDAGVTVGTIVITTPSGTQKVPVKLGASIPQPDLWWRLGHPFEVLGWN
jgi:D-alanyl-D-alanine carboxypeptidase (penicillin-binding protein 5/6)